MGTIETNLQAVKTRIAAACRRAGRDPREIVLVAVSKTCSPAMVRTASAAGQRDFGESYVQEALAKIEVLSAEGLVWPGVIWHFIGPIQSNKTRAIAEHFDWVHSVDRLKIAERLSTQRPDAARPLEICLQVNVSGEATKSGIEPREAVGLAQAIAQLPRLRLRGLMAIPEPTSDPRVRRERFLSLSRLREEIVGTGIGLDTLSMGMTADFEDAIEAGSTMIRVGTAIFGERVSNATETRDRV